MSEAIEKLLQIAPGLAEGMKPGPGHIMVRCPYHGDGREKTPSMSISTWKPVFFCHGCKISGHLAQLLGTYGLGANAIDIILPKVGGAYTKPETISTKIVKGIDPFRGKFVLDEGILDYYRLAPTALKATGYASKTLRHFEVGYDAKNHRVTYPLRTVFGDLVGISGRTLYEGIEPRYKIYDRELKERTDYHVPQSYTMEEVKSSVLWHGHVVRPMFFLRNSGKEDLVVTEGFKACMWTWQAGVEDTVALVGSYLTQSHAELIARATRKVILFLDNNEAGFKGTHRAGRLLLKKGCEVCVAKYPDQREQPDDLTPDEVHTAINEKETLRAWTAQHPDPEPLSKLLKRVSGR